MIAVADGISIDSSELDRLAADLGAAPAKASTNIRKAVQVTAQLVRDDWREPWQGSATVPGAARSISYDTKGVTGSGVSAEIGPELGGQGSLVGLFEEGDARNVGARGFGLAALQKNMGDFERGLTKAVEDIL